MDIVDALVEHHQVLRDLADQAEGDPAMFAEYVRHLVVHHTMEEKYFYDLLVQVSTAEHASLEAVNEHHIIELILKDAEGFPQEHQHFPIKVEGLAEYTNHHLDEEESEVFPMAREAFAGEDLTTLGTLFNEAKEKLLAVNLPALPASIDISGNKRSRSAAYGLGIGSLKK